MDCRCFNIIGIGLMVFLSVACQEDKKNNTPATGNVSGVAGKSFDAAEFSCKKKPQDRGANLVTIAEPTWDSDIKALMKSACLPCHAAGATPPDLSAYGATAETAADNLERMQRTGQGVMPPAGQLPQDQIALFKAWLDVGTPESADGGGGSEDAADPGNSEGDPDEDPEGADGEDADDASGESDGEYDSKLCPNAARQEEAKNQN